MKHLSYFISILLLVSFAACSDDDDFERAETPLNFGFFKGELNNKPISIENSDYEHLIHGRIYILNYRKADGTILDEPEERFGFSVMVFGEGEPELGLNFTPLKIGKYEMKGDCQPSDSSMISIQSDKVKYFPIKEPVKLEITDIRYPEPGRAPIIEGKMEGVLYNLNNPQDSIVFKNITFGAR